MQPLISVVVPVYNVEKYLRRCVLSIVEQSYSNIEIILVDDGSPDNSGELCDELAAEYKQIRVLHQNNQGLSGARNSGIDIAQGAYIAFVDSDDYIDPYMIEDLYDKLMKHNCQIAIGKYQRFSGKKYIGPITRTQDCRVLSSIEALIELHGSDGETYTVAWNKLYDINLFETVRYPEGRINEDEFVTYRLLGKAMNIVYLDQIVYYYYHNDVSITSNLRYLSSTDYYLAMEERATYLMTNGYKAVIPSLYKALANRIISRYKMIMMREPKDIEGLSYLRSKYMQVYKKNEQNISGVGYRIFYIAPRLYFKLYDLKMTFRK